MAHPHSATPRATRNYSVRHCGPTDSPSAALRSLSAVPCCSPASRWRPAADSVSPSPLLHAAASRLPDPWVRCAASSAPRQAVSASTYLHAAHVHSTLNKRESVHRNISSDDLNTTACIAVLSPVKHFVSDEGGGTTLAGTTASSHVQGR